MRLERYYSFLLLIMVISLASCEKSEVPVPLPPKGSAEIMQVETGEDYEYQVFFDFETGKIVAKNEVRAWDLAFEASSDGFHVFMNGDKNVYVYNAGNTSISSLTNSYSLDAVKKSSWRYDAPCGLPDSTGIGDWRDGSGNSQNNLYILKFDGGSPDEHVYKKIMIESVSSTGYVLKYGDLNSTSLSTINIPKNPLYNYSFFTFDSGGKIIMNEPPKDSWDIVFTHYRYIYYDLNDFAYLVSGVLLNPYNTSAKKDSSIAFASMNYDGSIPASAYSNHRDIIGFTWKAFDRNTMRYSVNSAVNYIIKNRKGQFWKMHFLDFYNSSGIKGSPSFEYERIN